MTNDSRFAAMLAWLPFAFATLTLVGPLGHGEVRCKYSVRDVAFVNVHGKSWQLELVKPGLASLDFDLAGNSQVLTDALARANLGFVWHEAESAAAKRLGAESNQTKMQMFLTNQQGQVISLASKETSFAARIEKILSSPARARLIDQLTDSLCVFLVILGPDEGSNREALQTVNAAMAQVEKQMWMMEKASDKGPSLVQVNAQDDAEWLTLRSIGVDPLQSQSLPAVAVMFGQARRLGDIISGDQLEPKKLVALASICGSDCECEFDRTWLYGDQMIHRWTAEHERRTEASLDFDPHSAFVKAEVAQILQKNNSSTQSNSSVNLGSGLVIHDLDTVQPEPREPEPQAIESHSVADGLSAEASNSTAHSTDSHDSPAVTPAASESSTSEIPWLLLGGLSTAVAAVFLVRFVVGNRN